VIYYFINETTVDIKHEDRLGIQLDSNVPGSLLIYRFGYIVKNTKAILNYDFGFFLFDIVINISYFTFYIY